MNHSTKTHGWVRRASFFGGSGCWDAAEVAVFEPVAVTLEGDDFGVVDEAVDHGGSDDVIAEHLAPPNWSWHMFVLAESPC
jgi:hypothetical protein